MFCTLTKNANREGEMMKRIVLAGVVISFGLLVILASVASVHAYGVQPQVATHPDSSNQAVRLEVGGTSPSPTWGFQWDHWGPPT